MMEKHLHRSWIIDCCADGTLTCRPRGQWPFNSGVAVFSTDTEEEARELIVLVAKLQPWRHPQLPRKEPWYRLEWFSGKVEALPQVTELLTGVYRGMRKRGEVE